MSIIIKGVCVETCVRFRAHTQKVKVVYVIFDDITLSPFNVNQKSREKRLNKLSLLIIFNTNTIINDVYKCICICAYLIIVMRTNLKRPKVIFNDIRLLPTTFNQKLLGGPSALAFLGDYSSTRKPLIMMHQFDITMFLLPHHLYHRVSSSS